MRSAVRVCIAWLVALAGLSLSSVIWAQDVPGDGGWSAAAGAAGDNTYQGFVDRPSDGASIPLGSTFHVSGWVVDTSAQGWAGIDDVSVLNGSTVLAHGSGAGNRSDVAAATGNPYWAASGFDVVVPSGGLPAGAANLSVVAHTPGKGSWSKPLSVNIVGSGAVISSPTASGSGLVLTIITPANGEDVPANNNGIIRGIAYDTRTRADLGAGVDRVQAYLDGPRDAAGSQTLGTATLTDNSWLITWQPTRYDHVAHHILFVYARSAVTGEERLLNEELNIVR
jgi:hypothetical protein